MPVVTVQQPLSKLILPIYYPLHQPEFDKYSRIYLRGRQILWKKY